MKLEARLLARSTATLALACILFVPAFGRTVRQKKLAAGTQFETAERLREELNGTPESKRSRRDYQKVMDAYRKVYYTAPTVSIADVSVLAVAELLDEQGRVLEDPKSFKDAIGQLEFLRREYPGSKHRAEALFTMGQIYMDDLEDMVQAKATFEEYLKHYPRGAMAAQARKSLDDMELAARKEKDKDTKAEKGKAGRGKSARADVKTPEVKAPEAKTAKAPETKAVDVQSSARNNDDEKEPAAPDARHRQPLLTSIRHWSTPDYTRVAIDLEQEVKYEAGRVPHPNRIFFDLHGAKLAADLVGKAFDVEDGFLHRIRVAQYKTNVSRVVLDVDDVAEYSAFLLPNPYRLIIDIHGKQPAAPVSKVAANKRPDTDAGAAIAAAANAGTGIKPSANPDTRASVTPISTAPPATAPTAPAPPPLSASIGTTSSSGTNTSGPNTSGPNAKPRKIVVPADPPASSPGTIAADARAKGPSPTEKPVAETVALTDKTSDRVEKPVAHLEETKIEEKDKTTSKPTSGPTYQAIAPQGRGKSRRDKEAASTVHVAEPTAEGQRSLIRALGLKIGKIVIDAGHGGHDTGTIGPDGLEEKDLVLDVALKLGKMLEERLGAEVVYTRDDDTFIPLETRTAIANKERADLFISVHANSSDDSSARGVETYYLNFTSSKDALDVAARENAVSEKSIHELQDLVKKIAMKEKIEESREFANDVQKSLYTGLSAKNGNLRDRGVKKAPFIVLIGANMPSILAEISFVSNPGDEKKLKTNDYRRRIAESLYKGVAKYVNGLSSVRVAGKLPIGEQHIATGK